MLQARSIREKKRCATTGPAKGAFGETASKLPPATVSFVDPNQTTA